MIRGAVIVVLLVLVAVLADRVAREENQRVALQSGVCAGADQDCLNNMQTRTSWALQFLHGLIDPLPQVPWTSEVTPAPSSEVSSSAGNELQGTSSELPRADASMPQ